MKGQRSRVRTLDQSGRADQKKASLERAIDNESVNAHTLARIAREWTATLNTLKRMFPDVRINSAEQSRRRGIGRES
jgi:hypothetical protein